MLKMLFALPIQIAQFWPHDIILCSHGKFVNKISVAELLSENWALPSNTHYSRGRISYSSTVWVKTCEDTQASLSTSCRVQLVLGAE